MEKYTEGYRHGFDFADEQNKELRAEIERLRVSEGKWRDALSALHKTYADDTERLRAAGNKLVEAVRRTSDHHEWLGPISELMVILDGNEQQPPDRYCIHSNPHCCKAPDCDCERITEQKASGVDLSKPENHPTLDDFRQWVNEQSPPERKWVYCRECGTANEIS